MLWYVLSQTTAMADYQYTPFREDGQVAALVERLAVADGEISLIDVFHLVDFEKLETRFKRPH